jgi:hypothetical protein
MSLGSLAEVRPPSKRLAYSRWVIAFAFEVDAPPDSYDQVPYLNIAVS